MRRKARRPPGLRRSHRALDANPASLIAHMQVFGETAIAQGKVSEKRVIDGKETYMELVYADILRKRDGRWVVVQGMGAKIE
jgi:hypothetical protein